MDNIHLGKEAKQKLFTGINKASELIAGTLGPTGYSVILEDPLYPGHLVADDGYAVLKKIKLEDPIEQRGVELLKESVEKSNRESGDGSTTSTILTTAILKEGLKQDRSGQEIKKELDSCLPDIEKQLNDISTQITEKDIAKVATVSSGDKELGNLLQEIYEKIGKDGIIELDTSKTPETIYELVDGVRLHNAGFMFPYMANDDKGKRAVYIKPKILITKQKINVLKDLDPLFQSLSSGGTTELVIFCDEIDPAVSQTLALTHQQGLFKTLVIKAPTLWKDWLFEDFAMITGAKIIDQAQGTSLQRMSLSYLGTCEKLISTKEETIVIGITDITEHVAQLEEDGKTDEQQLVRASWLKTKTAILKVGANSESELSLKRLKAEDARNAAFQALQGGIVEGAGKALLQIKVDNPILAEAFRAPYNQLLSNMAVKEIDTQDVVDPKNVVWNAIKNAVSVAGTILTSNGVVTLK